jgi:hypothetical protein
VANVSPISERFHLLFRRLAAESARITHTICDTMNQLGREIACRRWRAARRGERSAGLKPGCKL